MKTKNSKASVEDILKKLWKINEPLTTGGPRKQPKITKMPKEENNMETAKPEVIKVLEAKEKNRKSRIKKATRKNLRLKKIPDRMVLDKHRKRISSQKEIPTGIKGLDPLLGGGIAECSSFLVYGTPHCGKKPVLMQMLCSALKNKIPVILILTDFGVKRWKEMMQDSGWNLDRFKGRIYFIDAYSQQYSIQKDEDNVTYLQVPYPLSTLSIECTKFIETCQLVFNKKPLVIMHSLSTLIEHFGEAEVFNFTQFFLGKLSNDCITSVYSMQKGMHSEKIETMIVSMFDGTLEMKDMQLRARGYMDIATPEWVPYRMSPKGVVVEFKEEKKEKQKPKKKAKKKKPAKEKKSKPKARKKLKKAKKKKRKKRPGLR